MQKKNILLAQLESYYGVISQLVKTSNLEDAQGTIKECTVQKGVPKMGGGFSHAGTDSWQGSDPVYLSLCLSSLYL